MILPRFRLGTLSPLEPAHHLTFNIHGRGKGLTRYHIQGVWRVYLSQRSLGELQEQMKEEIAQTAQTSSLLGLWP